MKKSFILFYFLLITSCQPQNHISDKFADTIKKEDMYNYLSILTADSIEGRETGTEGQKKAAEFIKNKFEKFGLIPWIKINGEKSYYQKFRMHKKGFKKSFDLPMFIIKEKDVNKNELDNYVNTENVIGYIKGSEKENEYIVISAHYDHLGKNYDKIFHGADDNGSGTSALLEIAEAFSEAAKNKQPPKRSIIFAAFTGEEKGLVGSRYFMEFSTVEPVKIVTNLNIDMIGRNGDDFVHVIGASMITPNLEELIENLNDKYTKLYLDYSLDDGLTPSSMFRRSDHYNFSRFGIPAVFFYSGHHKDYHRPSDTIDKINFKGMLKRTKLIFYTAWELANMKQRIDNFSPQN